MKIILSQSASSYMQMPFWLSDRTLSDIYIPLDHQNSHLKSHDNLPLLYNITNSQPDGSVLHLRYTYTNRQILQISL